MKENVLSTKKKSKIEENKKENTLSTKKKEIENDNDQEKR